MDSNTDIKTWPLVASAMNIGVTELNDGREELIAEEYATLTKTIVKVSDETKRNSSSQAEYARWRGISDNKDVITNLLLLTYNAIEHDTGTTAKTELFELIKNEAVASVNEVKETQSYVMPTEADIAGKKGFPDMKQFLLSPTETSLSLNLSKAGRMAVHRIEVPCCYQV